MYTLFLLFPALVLARHSVAALWGFPKRFSVQNKTIWKSDEETIRSLCGILVHMWWSYEWALERVGRVVEERRGRGEERMNK